MCRKILQEPGKFIIILSTTGAVLAGPGGPSTLGGGASWDLDGGSVSRGAWGGLKFFLHFSWQLSLSSISLENGASSWA